MGKGSKSLGLLITEEVDGQGRVFGIQCERRC